MSHYEESVRCNYARNEKSLIGSMINKQVTGPLGNEADGGYVQYTQQCTGRLHTMLILLKSTFLDESAGLEGFWRQMEIK